MILGLSRRGEDAACLIVAYGGWRHLNHGDIREGIQGVFALSLLHRNERPLRQGRRIVWEKVLGGFGHHSTSCQTMVGDRVSCRQWLQARNHAPIIEGCIWGVLEGMKICKEHPNLTGVSQGYTDTKNITNVLHRDKSLSAAESCCEPVLPCAKLSSV